MCFVWISEQTAIISLYNINWLFFVTQKTKPTVSVILLLDERYCAIRRLGTANDKHNTKVNVVINQ